MMIGDDDVDAALARFANHFGSSNAGVHADYQGDAHGRGAFDDVGPHSIAFFQSMRNVVAGFAAGHLDGFLQNDDGHGAVDVVVAVDQNLFFRLDGGFDARNGVPHAGEQQWIVQVSEVGGEEAAGSRRIAQSPVQQHAGGYGLKSEFGGEITSGLRICGRD